MFSYLLSYFDPSLQHTKRKDSKYIYRDELDKKATYSTNLRGRTYHKTQDKITIKSPLLRREDVDQEAEKMVIKREKEASCEEKRELRVKVLMTREEAVRLLSKCKEGGLLDFSDVAHEFNKIPTNRVTIVDSSTTVVGHVLHSIAEEF